MPDSFDDSSASASAPASSNGLYSACKARPSGGQRNYQRFLNATALRRKPSAIPEMCKMLHDLPSTIALSTGFPNPTVFPFRRFTFELKDGTCLSIEGQDMNLALQYCPTEGLPDLVSLLRRIVELYHSLNPESWTTAGGHLDLLPSPGAQDGLCKIFEATVNPGEAVVCEEYVYSGMIAAVNPLGCNFLTVKGDKYGMTPETLRQALETSVHKPKVIYLCPSGGNPTGATIPEDRRRAIYDLACAYDLLLIEDDPYFFLQFAEPVPPSFLSMDREGRVIRLDSFSKVLSAGLRFGWITGPAPILKVIMYHQQASFALVPTMTQIMLIRLLELWDKEGFESHVSHIRDFYRKQRDMALDCVERHLTGLCDWGVPPSGGMFLWMRVLGIRDTFDLIRERAMKAGVAFFPGAAFCVQLAKDLIMKPDGTHGGEQPYLRASYSLASYEQMDKGFKILSDVIKDALSESALKDN